MSRGIATCTCRICGKNFDKELYEFGKGASSRLAEKIKWAENGGIDECPDCWKSRKLTCQIRLGNAATEPDKIYAVFGGDSYSHKDALKAAGCRWTEYYPQSGALAELISVQRPRPAWVLKSDDMDVLLDAATSLGATVSMPSSEDIAIWASLVEAGKDYKAKTEAEAAEKEAQNKARMEAEIAGLGNIPQWPESVKARWPSGATWNCKVYGKKGRRSIYLSGNKVEITDDEADAMETAHAAREAWREKRDAIKKKYGKR